VVGEETLVQTSLDVIKQEEPLVLACNVLVDQKRTHHLDTKLLFNKTWVCGVSQAQHPLSSCLFVCYQEDEEDDQDVWVLFLVSVMKKEEEKKTNDERGSGDPAQQGP
jgi:hypothetical protein